MNRYAYVEGAPDTFVDHLGFFRAAAAIQAQKLAALQAAFGSAIEELNELAGWFARVHTPWSAKQMLAHYNTYYASDDPDVRAAMDKIARNAFDGVNSFNNQVNMQAALGQVAYQYRLREAERQQKLYMLELQEAADLAEIQAEYDGLLFYHTVNQTATVLKDPSFAVHTVLDVSGMVPGIGEVADLINAGIYAAEGDWVNASISMAAMIPFAGMAASGARVVKSTYRAVTNAIDVADAATDAIRLTNNLPLTAATPPAPSIITTTPVLPTVKAPDITIPTTVKLPDVQVPTTVLKTPDIPVMRSGTPDAPSTSNVQYRSDDPRYYAASVTPGGHPAGEAVIAGHGELRLPNDTTVVPEGTRVVTYAEDGQPITDQVGRAVEGGQGPTPVGIYEAGETMPNYTVKAPDKLNVLDESIMVSEPTLLENLLEPGMGNCHFAICLVTRY